MSFHGLEQTWLRRSQNKIRQTMPTSLEQTRPFAASRAGEAPSTTKNQKDGGEVAEEAPSSTKSPKKRSAVSTAQEVGNSKRGMSSAGAGCSAALPPPSAVSRKPATKAEDPATTESEVEITSGRQRFRRESDLIATNRTVLWRLGEVSCYEPKDL